MKYLPLMTFITLSIGYIIVWIKIIINFLSQVTIEKLKVTSKVKLRRPSGKLLDPVDNEQSSCQIWSYRIRHTDTIINHLNQTFSTIVE